jgi:hypothetical protein
MPKALCFKSSVIMVARRNTYILLQLQTRGIRVHNQTDITETHKIRYMKTINCLTLKIPTPECYRNIIEDNDFHEDRIHFLSKFTKTDTLKSFKTLEW